MMEITITVELSIELPEVVLELESETEERACKLSETVRANVEEAIARVVPGVFVDDVILECFYL